jgi:hypothetical protein
MMNGMNFFNLNTANSTPSLFGSNTVATATSSSNITSPYKENCKYGSSTQDDEDIDNDDDGDRIMNDSGNQVNNKANNSNHANNNGYNDRTNEHRTLISGEETNATANK